MFSLEITDYDKNNILLCDPTKNSIIQSSIFYKLIYSNPIISFNGIYIVFTLKNVHNNKDKFLFKYEDNINIINKISNIENDIFNLIDNHKSKNKSSKITDNLLNGYIKYNTDYMNTFESNNIIPITNTYNSKTFILKISGIWETNDEIGITFKFILVDRYINIQPSVE